MCPREALIKASASNETGPFLKLITAPSSAMKGLEISVGVDPSVSAER